MSTENETWRDASSGEENSGNKFDKENSYNRPERPRYNNDGGDRPQRSYNNDRPYRPRFNSNSEGGDRPQRSYGDNNDRPQRSYGDNSQRSYGDRPYRPRFNSEGGGDRPQRSYGDNNDRPQRPYGDRPRFNSEGGDRPQRPSYGDRPRPNYNNGGGGDRPQRPYGDRPRFNSEGGDRPQRPYGDRPQRPSYNNGGGGDRPQRSYGDGDRPQRPYGDRPQRSYGDRPQRPNYNSGGGDRPYRPRFDSAGGGSYDRPRQYRTADYDPNAKYSKKKQIEYKEQFADPNAPIRLNKFLANAGVCSRREADEFITAGVVSVNGAVVVELGTKIKRVDEVKFHDQLVSIERKIYVLLNKPKDCVTTSDDPQARLTVMDLVKGACDERIYPVGRLDRNTTGVLLLTNDGDLASKLTHPKFLKKKIYQVHTDKNVTKADMEKIAAGVELDDGEIHADAISYSDEVRRDEVGIEIHSGKNRVVRRIFESLGYKVMKLDRVFFAGLTKKSLRRGEWRYLSEQEVNYLRMGSFE